MYFADKTAGSGLRPGIRPPSCSCLDCPGIVPALLSRLSLRRPKPSRLGRALETAQDPGGTARPGDEPGSGRHECDRLRRRRASSRPHLPQEARVLARDRRMTAAVPVRGRPSTGKEQNEDMRPPRAGRPGPATAAADCVARDIALAEPRPKGHQRQPDTVHAQNFELSNSVLYASSGRLRQA